MKYKKAFILVLMLTVTGCSSLVSHPRFHAQPAPDNYHRSQSIATGYRNSDWIRDYLSSCSSSYSFYTADSNNCGFDTSGYPWGQGETIARETFLFDTASATTGLNVPSGFLDGTNAHGRLELLAQRMKQSGACSWLNVVGHADSRGFARYNQLLSEERARSVADYLLRLGVTAHRIRSHGVGETQPAGSNATESGRAVNRRVDVQLYAQNATCALPSR
ncbi:OmpA family protein [Marinobacterium rhizophilum]|uniref:OmpA family protein n=1 Tax=Marinobacterium rhizophilum TaxID=420402 RepID=A0ABY5HI53_9GAMM|nr:OmpA family protein [Marinobacterium rhizophilum]UTW12045.1 OmpA family protein [Marinobacterium rhizophilum]